MNRSYDEALLLYLSHCNIQRQFFIHPLRESSAVVDDDWHLRNENGLIAIINAEGRVEYVQRSNLQLVR